LTSILYSVIPAQAGIQDFSAKKKAKMDTGFRRYDGVLPKMGGARL